MAINKNRFFHSFVLQSFEKSGFFSTLATAVLPCCGCHRNKYLPKFSDIEHQRVGRGGCRVLFFPIGPRKVLGGVSKLQQGKRCQHIKFVLDRNTSPSGLKAYEAPLAEGKQRNKTQEAVKHFCFQAVLPPLPNGLYNIIYVKHTCKIQGLNVCENVQSASLRVFKITNI